MHEFLQILLMSFPLTELVMYPSAVINLICESNNILNAESPSGESWNMSIVLGTSELFIINYLHRKLFKQVKCL